MILQILIRAHNIYHIDKMNVIIIIMEQKLIILISYNLEFVVVKHWNLIKNKWRGWYDSQRNY